MLVMSERISDHLPKTKKFHPKQRLWYIRAKEVLISSGSIERPIVFGNNDTPGVMPVSYTHLTLPTILRV